MLDIDAFMAELAQKRPLFHSEADFQHAFAWQLKEWKPNANIRLEYPFDVGKWIYVDIWSRMEEDISLAIELKYKTSKLQLSYADEPFHLKSQSAQDLGRYDFLKDVQRLESISRISTKTIGLAVILSNDSGYWNKGRSNTVDADFRIHHSQVISGSLNWSENASVGTTKGREETLAFRNEYTIDWYPYSSFDDVSRGEFQYCAVRVNST